MDNLLLTNKEICDNLILDEDATYQCSDESKITTISVDHLLEAQLTKDEARFARERLLIRAETIKEERERIIKWGLEICPHWDGAQTKEVGIIKRDCSLCWQALEKGKI